MAIVTGGLGQPEEGSLVSGGLGISETNPNALRAVLSGSGAIVGTLTAGGAPVRPPGGSGVFLPQPRRPEPAKRRPRRKPAYMEARLSGTSSLTASLGYEIDADHLIDELAVALLLDLV